jgi:hypothetical protein
VRRTRGHDVVELRDALAPNTPDAEIWAHDCAHGLIVITCNRMDYLALAERTAVHPGLILLFRRRTHQTEAGRLLALLENASEQGLAKNIHFA